MENISGVCWISTSNGTIAVILIKDENRKKPQGYLGIVKGETIEEKVKSVVDWGEKINPKLAKKIIKEYGGIYKEK